MADDLVDLVSSTEEEDARPLRKRRIVNSSSESSEEEEEESGDDDDECQSSLVDFDEVFDDEAEYVPPPPSTSHTGPTIELSDDSDSEMQHEEEDEEEKRMEMQRKEILRDIKTCDDDERRLKEDLVRLETMIATVQSRRDAHKRELASLSRNASAKNKTWSSERFPHSKALRRSLKLVFGFDQFRELQLQAMNATLCGRDCFVVLPTGSGKSLLFQLPAVIQGGVTLVISPLLSLSRDQIYNLEQRGVQAIMISSGQGAEELKQSYARLRNDDSLRLVYVTPEMLVKSNKFKNALQNLHKRKLFTRICIDEAHCCSTMGHDFRPDYQKLHILRPLFPGVPILCVTATATVRVEEDVRETLQLDVDWVCFRSSFNRPNLEYEVVEKQGEHSKFMYQLLDICCHRFKNQSGIIYCFSKKDTERITQDLCNEHVAARCYHSKIPAKEQAKTHALWREGKIKIVVATTSFGMGIDMPTVRFVVHACLSTSIEGYVQESGRAGRDGLPASCILLYRRADVMRVSSLIADKKNGLDKLKEMISYCENVLECRRVITGLCFGEAFDSTKCNAKCDVCAAKQQQQQQREAFKVDHTVPAENLLRRFIKLRACSPSVTMNQLIEAWRKADGGRFLCPQGWSTSDCERLVIHLLLHDVFKIVWAYTSYGANSYLEQGDRGHLLCMQSSSSPSDQQEMRIEYGVRAEDAVSGRKRSTAVSPSAAASIVVTPKATTSTAEELPLFQPASKLKKPAKKTADGSNKRTKATAATAAAAANPARTIKSMFAAAATPTTPPIPLDMSQNNNNNDDDEDSIDEEEDFDVTPSYQQRLAYLTPQSTTTTPLFTKASSFHRTDTPPSSSASLLTAAAKLPATAAFKPQTHAAEEEDEFDPDLYYN